MTRFLTFLGFILLLIGGAGVVYGLELADFERGQTQAIVGSVGVFAGSLVLAMSGLLKRVDQLCDRVQQAAAPLYERHLVPPSSLKASSPPSPSKQSSVVKEPKVAAPTKHLPHLPDLAQMLDAAFEEGINEKLPPFPSVVSKPAKRPNEKDIRQLDPAELLGHIREKAEQRPASPSFHERIAKGRTMSENSPSNKIENFIQEEPEDWFDRQLAGFDEAPLPPSPVLRPGVLDPQKQEPRHSIPPKPVVEQPSLEIVGQHEVNGMTYTLYNDGSIEATTPTQTKRFSSLAELRAYMEQHEDA